MRMIAERQYRADDKQSSQTGGYTCGNESLNAPRIFERSKGRSYTAERRRIAAAMIPMGGTYGETEFGQHDRAAA